MAAAFWKSLSLSHFVLSFLYRSIGSFRRGEEMRNTKTTSVLARLKLSTDQSMSTWIGWEKGLRGALAEEGKEGKEEGGRTQVRTGKL